MSNLWSANHPRNFWKCQPDPSDDLWTEAIANALPLLGLSIPQIDIDSVLALTLGEGRFGPDHWTLSLPKKIYYLLKPVLPRWITKPLRRMYSHANQTQSDIKWPIESRYVQFLWEVMCQLLHITHRQTIAIKTLWPDNQCFAFLLTHDIETGVGQECVRMIADLEESLGFRSSFQFIPEEYAPDLDLMNELRERGFEVGVHGLKHDGRLFTSRSTFQKSAESINGYLAKWGAVGFRSPLTHRHPEWMQMLDIEYDLSFFDTDPFEPIPGGCMSIWPFFIGHFVELPYTLVQDCSLALILKETTPRYWLEKIDFICRHGGMVLINSHPDYLADCSCFNIYVELLKKMKERNDYWHALPREVSRWWKNRSEGKTTSMSYVTYDGSKIQMIPAREETMA